MPDLDFRIDGLFSYCRGKHGASMAADTSVYGKKV